MEEEKYDDLKDVIFNLDIEGTIFYPNEDNQNDFFIAWAMSVITIDEDDQDCEFKILDIIKSELSDDKLIFANLGPNYETYRIVGLPEIQYFEFESSMSSLIADTNIKAAIEFLTNLKTINFSDLKSKNNNFKFIKTNETEVIIEKTYHDNGELKEEFETLNGERHGYYKLYHENGQIQAILHYENDIQVDGIIESFDENGSLIRSVLIKNGNLNGPFKEYYSSGKIKREGEYKDDEILGIPVEYLEDGEIRKSLKNFENTITPDNISQIKFENKFGIRRIVDQLVDLDKKYYQQVTYGLILLWVMDNDDDQIEGDLVCDLFSFLFSDEKKSFVNMDNIEIDDIEPRDDENFPLDELESIYKRDIENYGIELKRIVDIEKIKLFAINFIENYEV
jgi:antitoxin component YwqK of YwqJK toxin-antitoxin module